MARIGRATGKMHCDEGEQQSGGIGEHMSRISQQSERARDQPANHFNHHKGRGDAKREHQAPGVVVLRRIGVRMCMRHENVLMSECITP
ncbi:hypothetical protein D3C80_1653720 [compost metagenome]